MQTSRLSPLFFQNGFVYGWAHRGEAGAQAVHLYVDGRHVASELTGTTLPAGVARQLPPLPQPGAGFAFALPRQALDGFEHRVHVGMPGARQEAVHGEAVMFKASTSRGEVRQQGRLFVGTAWFDKRPARAQQLQVLDDSGKVLLRHVLQPSARAEAQGYPAAFSIDREEWPEGPLRFVVNGQELRGSPCRRSTQLVGMVEEISDVAVRGWAFDGADARRPIELLLRIDGHDAVWFRPNVRRPEIARQVGIDEEGWGLVGFEMATPAALKDGEPHRVEIVLAESGQALSKGQQTVCLNPVGLRVPVIPARSAVIPARSAVIPARSAVIPAHSPVIPAHSPVIPAKAGIQSGASIPWIPAFAGMTKGAAGMTKEAVGTPKEAAGMTADAGLAVKPLVSAVVLSRNGAGLLDAFLRSWAQHLTSIPAEIIVVDHGSTDGSVALLRAWQARLPLKVIALDHNGSFSESSNLGAKHASGEYLLFANNDIVWVQDVVPRLLETLRDPQVGIAGLKLLKIVGESRDGSQHAHEVQHLGVRFKLNDRGYWPYEATPSSRHRELEHAPQHAPAVTGAVLMCRRADFDSVGGFDPAYFYGFEDVELCLRLAYRLRKSVVCRNDCLALHHHGHTRLSGRHLSIYDRLLRNSAVLQGHIGLWIKQAYWRSLLQGDGYITSEPLVIGIVTDADPAARKTPLGQAALALAGELTAACSHAEIVLLDPARDWKKVDGLHLLVVGEPRYDVRTLRGARADLLTVAWLHGGLSQWEALPWWRDFGGSLLAGASRADKAEIAQSRRPLHRPAPGRPLGGLLGTERYRLRVAIHAAAAHAAQALALQDALQAADLPCWLVPQDEWASHPAMADICVTLWDAASAQGPRPSMRSDVLNVLWLLGDKVKVPAEAKAEKCLVMRTMPNATELAQEMERRVGSTFGPP